MKKYIKSARESQKAKYGSRKEFYVEVLGKTYGDVEVYLDTQNNRYWWGTVPQRTLFNDGYPLDNLDIFVDDLMSDKQVISAVNNVIIKFVELPIAQRVSALLSIDLTKLKWRVFSSDDYIWIQLLDSSGERAGSLTIYNITHGKLACTVDEWFIYYLYKNGIHIDDIFKVCHGYDVFMRTPKYLFER